jgi:hypothetical protein
LTLRQADAARADLYAIHDELDFIKVQLARPADPTGSAFGGLYVTILAGLPVAGWLGVIRRGLMPVGLANGLSFLREL